MAIFLAILDLAGEPIDFSPQTSPRDASRHWLSPQASQEVSRNMTAD